MLEFNNKNYKIYIPVSAKVDRKRWDFISHLKVDTLSTLQMCNDKEYQL